MLETILAHLNNWFLVRDGVHFDTYAIKDGGLVLPFLIPGQYFRILGSVLNDGLHEYPASDLQDEVFTGTVWALAVPKSVVALSDEIKAWEEKNQPSAYASESFGGYSYSKASGADGGPAGWQDVFKVQLDPYRKPRELGFMCGQWPVKPYEPFNPNPWR